MLSRLALRNAQWLPTTLRGIQVLSNSTSASSNVPRPVRKEYPDPVRHGFIPDEWFTYFYPKTGVTGPYMFLISFGTFLVSKEIYVIEHEFFNGISALIVVLFITKKYGKQIGEYFNKELDNYENDFKEGRKEEIAAYENAIANMKKEIWRTEAQKIIFEIQKENIKMFLEGVYRERLAQVHNEVKKRLDYHVQVQSVERRVAQKHMVQWIVDNVMKSITPEQEKATLQQCIKDLDTLVVKH